MNKNELAEKIRTLRKASPLRQEDLAAKAGVSLRVVKELEGAKGNITWDNLNSILSVLGTSLEGLFSSGETPDKHETKQDNPQKSINQGHTQNGEKWADKELHPKRIDPNTQNQIGYDIAKKIVNVVDAGGSIAHTPTSEPNSTDFRDLIAILPTLNEYEVNFLLRQALAFGAVKVANPKPLQKDSKLKNKG